MYIANTIEYHVSFFATDHCSSHLHLTNFHDFHLYLMFVVLPLYNLQIYSLNLTLYEILNSNLTFFFMDVLISVKSPVDKPLLFKWLNVK